MAFTTHQLAKMILSRPDVPLDQAQGQGLGHKEPVTVDDGCRVWLKFYPPAHGKGAQASSATSTQARASEASVAQSVAPRIKRAKPEASAPVASPAPKASSGEADRMSQMEARLNALCAALGV